MSSAETSIPGSSLLQKVDFLTMCNLGILKTVNILNLNSWPVENLFMYFAVIFCFVAEVIALSALMCEKLCTRSLGHPLVELSK